MALQRNINEARMSPGSAPNFISAFPVYSMAIGERQSMGVPSGAAERRGATMTELDSIYSDRILELAANMPQAKRLARPDASATAHSKLCGSTVTIDLALDGGRIAAFGQTVKACLLGQASAAIVAERIIGSTVPEIHTVAAEMRRMLKEKGPPPSGRWSDLALLQPVRDYRARHASTLLVFDALEKALADIAVRDQAPLTAGE